MLGDSLLKTDPNIVGKDVDEVLSAMKRLAVIPIATGVVRSELLEMKQLRDEGFRKFASRVRGKAETFDYTTRVRCECAKEMEVNFTHHIMRDVLLAGIYDADERCEMYDIDRILIQPVNDVIATVEKKEMAKEAHSAANHSSMSSMKRQQQKNQQKLSESDKNKQGSCPHCKKTYALHREGRFGWNSKPFDMCMDCFKIKKRKKPSDNYVFNHRI